VLLAGGGAESMARLRILAESDDGFEIARADLRLRGMGDLFGAKQHGVPEFRFFDPERDESLLLTARQEAWRVMEKDPELKQPEHGAFRDELIERYGERAKMYEVG